MPYASNLILYKLAVRKLILVDRQTCVLYNIINEHMFGEEMCNMKEIGNFYVKLNCKNVDNIRSLDNR